MTNLLLAVICAIAFISFIVLFALMRSAQISREETEHEKPLDGQMYGERFRLGAEGEVRKRAEQREKVERESRAGK